MALTKKKLLKISILQNGSCIAKSEEIIGKNKRFVISSRGNSPFSIPHYSLQQDIEFASIKKQKFYLNLSHNWSGFFKSKSSVTYMCDLDRSKQEFLLDAQDYANLTLGDLRIMISIIPYHRMSEKNERKFRGTLKDLFFADRYESLSFSLALMCSILIGLVLVATALTYESKRPSKFEELEKHFTLPFIHNASFVTAPEAITKNLDREDLVKSIARFYGSISSLVMGSNIVHPQYIFTTTKNIYEDLYKKSMLEQKKIFDEIHLNIKKTKNIDHSAVLSLPSIYGESFQTKLVGLIEKIDSLHKSFSLSLKMRREASKSFRSDPEYDWGKYLGLVNSTEEKVDLSKIEPVETEIKVFERKTDEEIMYLKAEQLGEQAKALATYMTFKSEARRALNEKSLANIYIPTDLDFVSTLQNISDLNHNTAQMAEVKGVELATKSQRPSREPLIGSIDRTKLVSVIKKNRFDLNLCYELALRRNQNLRGRMNWTWRINSLGEVLDVSLNKSTLHDRQMITCLTGKITSWSFPHPKRGSVRIQHTFDFQPQDGISL